MSDKIVSGVKTKTDHASRYLTVTYLCLLSSGITISSQRDQRLALNSLLHNFQVIAIGLRSSPVRFYSTGYKTAQQQSSMLPCYQRLLPYLRRRGRTNLRNNVHYQPALPLRNPASVQHHFRPPPNKKTPSRPRQQKGGKL